MSAYPLGRAAVHCCVFLLSAVGVHAQNLSPLSSYSVITSGDFSTNSDVEGRTMVGGNLTGSNSATYGIRLQGQVSPSEPTLRVKGNISAGNPINLNAGSLELGGSANGRIVNYNGGGSLVSNPTADYSAVINQLTDASASIATMSANSNAFVPGVQPGPFVFNACPDSSGVAVLLIDGSNLFGNSNVQQIDLNVNGATDILINVAGISINWQFGNMVGAFTGTDIRSSVVWNFFEATSINFGSHNMMGQVLAPKASVTTQANIDGSIFAKSLTTYSEVHLPGYGGDFQNSPTSAENGLNGAPASVPEPSTAWLGAVGVLILLKRRRVS